MESPFRRPYNELVFTPDFYLQFKQRLQNEVGVVPYRIAETPLFVPPALRDRMMRYSQEIIAQLARPDLLQKARAAVPRDFDVPGQDESPHCMTVDFALTRNEQGELDARVVELQAFPSIYAFTLIQARIFDSMVKLPGAEDGFHCFAPGFDFESGVALLRRVLVGDGDPEETILMDIDPPNQKTIPDFIATQQLTGVEPVCVTQVLREGRQLFRMKGGRKIRIRRIFNRVVFDELFKVKPKMAFAFTDDLDVEWVTHPNWYWMWSKFSLPLLDHPAVPKTTIVAELQELPADLENYVLKPLFSFAGAGVIVDPTPEDVARLPADQRHGWVLQKKITYARELQTPQGEGVAAEIRILCLKDVGQKLPEPFMNLVRLSRGKMLGIDFNKGLDWVGSSVALWPRAK